MRVCMVGTNKSKKNRSRMRRGGECERKMKRRRKREDGGRVVEIGRGKREEEGGKGKGRKGEEALKNTSDTP